MPSKAASMISAWRLVTTTVALSVLGCRVSQLSTELRKIDELARIGGTVTIDQPTGAPIMVAVFKHAGRAGRPVQLSETAYLDSSRTYKFALEAGSYQIVAFEDPNANQLVDEGEQGASLGPLVFRTHEKSSKMDLHIVGPLQRELPESEDRRLVVAGPVDELDHERFGPTAGELGVWQPLAMMKFLHLLLQNGRT